MEPEVKQQQEEERKEINHQDTKGTKVQQREEAAKRIITSCCFVLLCLGVLGVLGALVVKNSCCFFLPFLTRIRFVFLSFASFAVNEFPG